MSSKHQVQKGKQIKVKRVSCYHAAGCSDGSSMSQDGFNDVRNANREGKTEDTHVFCTDNNKINDMSRKL